MAAWRNPFRTEAEAFRLLLVTVAVFAAITVASVLGGWKAGVPVFVAVSAAMAWYYLRPLPEPTTRHAPTRVGSSGERRILVVANETVGGRRLLEEIKQASSGYRTQVLVVSPALNSPIRHWASDDDKAREDARRRLNRSLQQLRDAGLDARGEVGDSDPVQAIEDALRTFGADQVILSTHPEGRSNWLERGVVTAAKDRFVVPITHVVVDLEAEAQAAKWSPP